MALQCMSCVHWIAQDRARDYAAPCALLRYPGRVPFDTTDCAQHSARPPLGAPAAPPVNAPPFSVAQMWLGQP